MMRHIVLILAASLLLPAGSGRTAEHDKVLVGYVYGKPVNLNYALYTHLCHAFVVAEEDGRLIPRENVPSLEFTTDAHRHGVKALLSLGGWGWDANFAAMSLNLAAEDRYVDTVVNLVDEFDYDGIDLDWEYPDMNIEIAGFERLARKFRKRLDALVSKKSRPMLLTMAAAAEPKTLEWLSNEFLLETMDWVHVMTYDYYGHWSTLAGHHSPLFVSPKMPLEEQRSVALTIEYFLNRKFPPNRLVLGIPLYGRGFDASEPYVALGGPAQPSREPYNYRAIAPLLTSRHWQRQWDNDTKNPWLIARDGSEIICYDDTESVATKTRWAMKHRLRGVFFWHVDADRLPDGTNPLQQSAANVVRSG